MESPLSFKDYETILVKLPASPSGTAAELWVLPETLSVAETAHTCKVRIVDFVTAGSINGNSGGGKILKLRDGAAAVSTIRRTRPFDGHHDVPGAKNDRASA
jgi:hypothetical protein